MKHWMRLLPILGIALMALSTMNYAATTSAFDEPGLTAAHVDVDQLLDVTHDLADFGVAPLQQALPLWLSPDRRFHAAACDQAKDWISCEISTISARGPPPALHQSRGPSTFRPRA